MAATQIHRPFRVKTPLGDDALLLESFEGKERVSTPFRFVLKVLAYDPNIDMKGLLHKPAVLTIGLTDSGERHVHGNINRMKLLEFGEDGYAAYEMEIVPWLWFLNLFSDCRIFQNMNVPDIVQKVFKDRGFSDFKLQTQGSYPEREYCVQYRETDFNFVSRLMEEEGIFYFFEHTSDKHTLVMGDQPSAFPTCPNQGEARFLPSQGGVLEKDIVHSLEAEFRVDIGTASLTDYNFEKPNVGLLSTLASEEKGEDYDYPGKYKTRDDGDRYARVRLEEKEVGLTTVRGASNCLGFECGYSFKLLEHYRDDANQEYTLTALEHRGQNSSYRAGTPDPFEYNNRLEAIPASVNFRPPRLARKPSIRGTQTAVVVGKSGEEIWPDKYGRVKVQFFWDREGVKDENSSCWIRVAQAWAGKQWGAVYTPRIGQEVIVSFLEGDPDQPIITGSVYNADQMPPYTLPDEKTKSALKTMSSKGGGGFNEIRFEDKKGSEQVFMHGEKDQDIRIKNDRKEWIGQDRHLIVTRDKFEKVERDDHIEITRDQIEKIGRDHHVEVAGKSAVKITGSNSLSVTGDVIEEFKANHSSQVTQNLYLKAMQVVIEASMGMTLKVGGNFITIDPSGVAIKGTMVQINSAGTALSGSPGSLVPPLAPTDAVEADKADPGAVTAAPSGSAASPANMALQSVAPVTASAVRRSAASDAPTHDPDSEENKDKKHWIEIELLDEAGKPVAGEPYRVTLPDGTTVADGTLDEKGKARVENVDPGTCKVTFPNLDQEAWEPK
ncbi:MAG TPA: type VI secretion system tip protein TssI/VgrG [Candidatus Acidoferrales bacterium]|nr:type VI secretion system tip protein TssI/VgrG [Candidatus Acidoferrales bacterium]